MSLLFNLSLSFRAIRTNLLRSVLTILIIGLGIMALVGILTSIEVIKAALTSNFSQMGANTFQVTSDILKQTRNKGGRGIHISLTEGKTIRYDEAKAFKARYALAAQIGIVMKTGGSETVVFGDRKTNPNIGVIGVDEAYFNISATKMDAGRAFSPYELQTGSSVCVLGNGIAVTLFKPDINNAVGKVISLGASKLRVVGVAESKGGNM